MLNEHEVGSATGIEIRQHMSTSFTLIVIAGYRPTVPNVVCTLAFAKKEYVCVLRSPLSRSDINDPLSSSEPSMITMHLMNEPNPHQSNWSKSAKDWVINTKTFQKQGRRTCKPLMDYVRACMLSNLSMS
jgi:hypothetical protein